MTSSWRTLLLVILLVVLATLPACQEQGAGTPTAALEPEGSPLPSATPFTLPTLLPTFTRPAQLGATETLAPTETPLAEGTVDFNQPVVEFRYRIPALGLDRRLEGNVSGQITLVDETTGIAIVHRNQSNVLLELQEALPELELEKVPEDCDSCVHFSYSLPVADEEDEGWLKDVVMLASVENYTSRLLGPHFPPGTIVGLRRSPTAYDVGHSLALTEDGMLYRWLATDEEVEAPVAVQTEAPGLRQMATTLAPIDFAERYRVDCPHVAIETLYLNIPGMVTEAETEETDEEESGEGESGEEEPRDEGRSIEIFCPAFSLPNTLLPLYLELNTLLEPTLADQGLPRPELEIPLATMLHYEREDGAILNLLADGAIQATAPDGNVYSDTQSSNQVMTLAERFITSGELAPGVEAYAAAEADNILLVRGPTGMFETSWSDAAVPAELGPEVEDVNDLLNELIGVTPEPEDEIGPETTGTTTATATVTTTATATTAATASRTPTPSRTPTATRTPEP